MKIFVGDLEVITSGVVHSKGVESVDFVLSDDMTLRLTVQKVDNVQSSIELKPEGDVLYINFVNPHVQLHFGPQDPLLVGSYNGRELFVQLRVNTFGAFVSYSVDYSFYMGAKID